MSRTGDAVAVAAIASLTRLGMQTATEHHTALMQAWALTSDLATEPALPWALRWALRRVSEALLAADMSYRQAVYGHARNLTGGQP